MTHTSAAGRRQTDAAVDERRQTPRIKIFGRLHGHLVALDVPVAVTGIGQGGLSIETPVNFPIGIVHEFQLAVNDLVTVRLKGRIVHCRQVSGKDDNPRYAAGVEFVHEEWEAGAEAVRDLIQRFA
jgi:hypothetical protein